MPQKGKHQEKTNIPDKNIVKITKDIESIFSGIIAIHAKLEISGKSLEEIKTGISNLADRFNPVDEKLSNIQLLLAAVVNKEDLH